MTLIISKHRKKAKKKLAAYLQHAISIRKKQEGNSIGCLSEYPLKNLVVGVKINADEVIDLLQTISVGEKQSNEFAKDSFVLPIKETSYKLASTKSIFAFVPKKDHQIYFMIMSKSLSMAKSFSYCITAVSLQSIAIKVDLWQPGIASMKNKLIK